MLGWRLAAGGGSGELKEWMERARETKEDGVTSSVVIEKVSSIIYIQSREFQGNEEKE